VLTHDFLADWRNKYFLAEIFISNKYF